MYLKMIHDPLCGVAEHLSILLTYCEHSQCAASLFRIVRFCNKVLDSITVIVGSINQEIDTESDSIPVVSCW